MPPTSPASPSPLAARLRAVDRRSARRPGDPLAGRVPASLRLTTQRGRGKPATISVIRDGHDPVQWTQNALAAASSLSPSSISALLHGKRRGYMETLTVVARALDVTLEELSTFLDSRRRNLPRRAPSTR